MRRISSLLRKSILFSSLLLCLLEGCGYNANAEGQQQRASENPRGSCSTEAPTQKNAAANRVAYTVSWEAVGADADNNRGVSALQVSALDVISGHLLWRKAPAQTSALYQSSLQQVADGVLYIAGISSQSTLVLAVDTRDGHTIWQYRAKQGNISAISVCANKLYLLIGHTEITALHANTGAVLWDDNESDIFLSDLVVTTQAIYIIKRQSILLDGMSSSVVALDTENGKAMWSKPYRETLRPTLSLVANGPTVEVINQVLSSSSSADPTMEPVNSVQALDGTSGKMLWQASMPPDMEQINVLAVGATIYLNGQDLKNQNQSLLVALRASDGKQLWLRKHSYDQITVLGAQDVYGYLNTNGDNPQATQQLCLLDGTTGKDRWCVGSLRPSQFSLSATRDTVIVEEELQPGPLTLQQNIYGIRKQDGTILWELPWKSSSPSVQTLTLVTVMEQQSFTSLQA